ncbi:MAG: nucleotidyltransferase domain-containing protein [Alphaproteobacteria bacterium]|nr:nucleotidyltransferase domain-containing protein [Alphaproteobacteria bacterium]
MNATRWRAIEELRRMVLAALGEHDAAVWLFGSCARGEPRQHSDIDIAILPRGALPLGFSPSLRPTLRRARSRMMPIRSICGTPLRRLSTRSAKVSSGGIRAPAQRG